MSFQMKADAAVAPELWTAPVDRGIRKGGQFKQTLALGLTYTLF